MSITVETEIDLECCKCGKPIQDEYGIVCEDCGWEPDETKKVLETILPYINEATVLRPVEIPGEVAFLLKEKIRDILGK